jgi:ADP-dependent NAD(P)H-hydrate dehydratase / NAD(P)H-hydrate epimerase
MKLVNVAEMRTIEQEANERGTSFGQMMITAGEGVAKLILRRVNSSNKSALGLVGPGNNGGDALVTLIALSRAGWEVTAYLVRPRPADDPLIQLLAGKGGEIILAGDDVNFHTLDRLLASSAVLVDGVLGTGITLPLRQDVSCILGHVCAFAPRTFRVVAVDCPSGVDCDTGMAADETIPADLTVCMEAAKIGLATLPGFGLCGEIVTVDLGLPKNLASSQQINKSLVDAAMVRAVLPERRLDAHKGSFGTLMVVAGSTYYMGAALLAGQAAYRIGTGLVQMAVAAPLQPVLAGQLPEAIWLPLPHDNGFIASEAVGVLNNNLKRATCLLLGPGLSQNESTAEFVRLLVENSILSIKRNEPSARFPYVIDADGIRLVGQVPQWFKKIPPNSVLTPHAGEMSALTNLPVADILRDRIKIAATYAQDWEQVVVLKGALTVVASPTGEIGVVPVATPALARAGTGDVLAGMIAGLVAQKVDPFQAAWAAAYLHGRAGLLAAQKNGCTASVLAGDVSRQIGWAIHEVLA